MIPKRPRGTERHWTPAQHELFAPALPEGLEYADGFVSADEEAALLAAITDLPLAEARYRGYTARRRILSFGTRYDFDDDRLQPADPLPGFLLPLRQRAAAWAGVAPEALAAALVAEYRPGTPLGWHRDVPDYELVVGVSLGAPARMRLRPYPPGQAEHSDVISLDLAPRSAYILRGAARWEWQHSIAPTRALRRSITFRTRRPFTR
jgi:alkylated DNA repair dioxygenase AlkB